MLGFTAIGEVTIGEFSASPHRQAPITGVSATGAVRQLSLGADQAFAATGVTATGAVQDAITTATVDADANITPPSAVGTGAVQLNIVFGYVAATISSGVSGTSAVGAITDVTGKHQPTGVSATGGLNIGVSADATFTISSVSATATFGDFEEEDAQGRASLTGVTATSAAGWRDSDPDIPNGVYRALFIEPTSSDPIRRIATVNIVPYREYKVYITG